MLINAADGFNPTLLGFVAAGAFLVLFLFWKSTSHSEEKNPTVVSAVSFIALFAAIAAIALYGSPMFTKISETMNPLTVGFMGVIVLFATYFHCNYNHTIAHKAPAVLTTLGILGTFVGIALGLTDFNVNDVQKSIPALIDGMKTAFWASACGIFWAITIKLRDVMSAERKKMSRQATATINDLVAQLSALLAQSKLAHKDSNEKLDKLTKLLTALADDTNLNRLAFAEKSAVRLAMVG